jgi:hypothetical protein
VLSIFEREFAGAAVVRFCRDRTKVGSWDRTLHLIHHSGGPCLPHSLQAAGAVTTSAAADGTGATRGTDARLKRRA